MCIRDRAYFTHARNLDDPAVLVAVANEAGLGGAVLAERAGSQPVKDRLRANTDEAIARGSFGSPTIIVHEPAGEEQLYFGNDQLPLVRAKVAALA